MPSNRRLQSPPGRTGSRARGSCNYRQQELEAINIGSKSKHREKETEEINPDFMRVSFPRNIKSAALGVSGFKKRNMAVLRAVSLAIQLDISFPLLWDVGRRSWDWQAPRTSKEQIFVYSSHLLARELLFRSTYSLSQQVNSYPG